MGEETRGREKVENKISDGQKIIDSGKKESKRRQNENEGVQEY